MIRVLITGANSFVGVSVERWLKKTPEDFQVDSKGRDYVPRSIQKEVVEWLGRNLGVVTDTGGTPRHTSRFQAYIAPV